MDFKIDQKLNGNELELAVTGKLTNSTSPALYNIVIGLNSNITKLVFEFKDLQYLASAGIRVLIEAAKRMEGKGEMLIRHCNPSVMEIFTITNLTGLFKIEN